MKRLLLSVACVTAMTLGLAGSASAQGFGIYIGNGGYGGYSGYNVGGYRGYGGGYGGYGYGYSPRVTSGYNGFYNGGYGGGYGANYGHHHHHHCW